MLKDGAHVVIYSYASYFAFWFDQAIFRCDTQLRQLGNSVGGEGMRKRMELFQKAAILKENGYTVKEQNKKPAS